MRSSRKRSEALARCVAQRLELGVCVPARNRLGLADACPEAVDDLGELGEAAKVEVRPILVGWLVVAVRSVIVHLHSSPVSGMSDVVVTAFNVDGRDSYFCEREMVGAVEMSRFGVCLRNKPNSFATNHGSYLRPQRALVVAKHLEIAKTSQQGGIIDVEIGDDVLHGHGWMLAEVLRSKQA